MYSGGWKALFPWQQSKQRRKDETIWDYTSHWLELISCWLSSRLNTAINNIILTQLSPSNTPEHSATATGSRCTRQVLTLQQCIRVYDTHTHTTRSVCFPEPRPLSALRRGCCRSLFLNIQPFDFREMFPADSADSLLSLSRPNIVQTCSGVLLEESLDHVGCRVVAPQIELVPASRCMLDGIGTSCRLV